MGYKTYNETVVEHIVFLQSHGFDIEELNKLSLKKFVEKGPDRHPFLNNTTLQSLFLFMNLST